MMSDILPDIMSDILSDILPDTSAAGGSDRALALARLIRALKLYPAPIPVPPLPGERGAVVRYALAFDGAMTIYAERFQQSAEVRGLRPLRRRAMFARLWSFIQKKTRSWRPSRPS